MPPKTSDQVINQVRTLKPMLSEQYHIIRIGIFGSTIRGDRTEGSDIDILVEFSEPPGLFRFMEIENLLSDILNAPVDLVEIHGIKPRLKDRILSEVAYV
jgi:predicted nucleotidyltransferase